MSFSYDNSLSDTLSQLRNYIQDTDELTADFQDEELEYFLAIHSDNVLKAAKEASFRLYVKYSKLADIEQVGKIRIEYRNRAIALKDLYDMIKTETAKQIGKPLMYFGGISRTNFDSNRNDGSLVKPSFTKGTTLNDPYNQDLQYPQDVLDVSE